MATQRGDEFPVARVPQFHAVVEARGCDAGAVRRERDVQDLFLVAEEAGNGFDRRVGGRVDGCGVPEEDRVVVGRGEEFFHQLAFVASRGLEAGFCFLDLFFRGRGHLACVVVVGGAEGEVGGESQMVDPVCVGGEGV